MKYKVRGVIEEEEDDSGRFSIRQKKFDDFSDFCSALQTGLGTEY